MADVAHQGQSSVINEDLLGNDRATSQLPRLKVTIAKLQYS